jgi:F-type H+/Na+-transporting ATPase subunit alpha
VAGQLRLALAQYRELAAFAQLSTDLDKATKDQLTRGERMVEILKQDILQPIPFERQVVVTLAGNEGHLDDVPLSRVAAFEKELLAFMDKNYHDVFHTIKEKKAISDDVKKNILHAIQKFKEQFK